MRAGGNSFECSPGACEFGEGKGFVSLFETIR